MTRCFAGATGEVEAALAVFAGFAALLGFADFVVLAGWAAFARGVGFVGLDMVLALLMLGIPWFRSS